MKRLSFLTIFTIFALCLLAFSAARAQTVNDGIGDRGVYTTRLANGLQVIVVEDPVAPVVHTAMWYRFGSLYETPGKTGLAHALEHMMFRGTSDLSSGGLDDVIARIGGEMNGETNYDYTNFVFDLPADKLAVALQIEADRMQHLSLKPSAWNVERGAVLSEIDGDESSPFFNLLARVRAAAYPGLPAGRTPIGVRADVARATVADLRTYYREWYAPNNAALVIAGDVRHETAFAMAKHFFGAIPARKLPAHVDVHPHAATGQTVDAQFPFPFEVLDLAYAVPGDTEPGEPAISTLATLISDELGPFYQALVESNVALAVEANSDTQLKGGLMNVFIVLNPGHTAPEAQGIFQATMLHAIKDGFSPSLVRAAKRETLAERVFAGDSIGGYADLAGYTYGIVGETMHAEDARLEALTPQALQNAARTFLARPNVIGLLTPSDQPPRGSSQKSSAAASDNFTSRVPSGPIIEPASLRAAARRPTTARSKLSPVQFRLANGLRVIVQVKPDRPTVRIGGTIASSPNFVPHGEEGIIRLASAVANFGSAHYDFTQMREATDQIGASVTLGQEFGAQGFARDLPTLLRILADGEEHPEFPERWVALQRSQIAGSIASENAISGVIINRSYLERLLAPDDPALRYATQDSVSGITRADLVKYAATYWRPDLTTIAIVGDVNPEQVRSEVEAAFGSWTNHGATPSLAEPPLPSAHAGHAYIGTSANEVYVRLGEPAVGRNSPDYTALELLSQILAGPGYFESRLWQELRQKRGLVYSVGSRIKSDAQRGDFEIVLSAAPANVEPAIAIVRRELARLRARPVTAREMTDAKTRLVASALLAEASAQGQLDQVETIAQNHLPDDYYATLAQRLAAITPADLERVAVKYLHPRKLIEVFAGPSGPWAIHGL